MSITEQFGGTKTMSDFEKFKKEFDVVIGGNECRVVDKGKSTIIYGLCGCVGGYVDNPHNNVFFHYDVFRLHLMGIDLAEHADAQSKKVHFFVPGDWHKGEDGKYKFLPQKKYTEEILKDILLQIRVQGVECIIHPYNKLADVEHDYSNTVSIDRNGKLFIAATPVQAPQDFSAKPELES